MSAILTALGAIGSFLSFIGKLFGWIERKENIEQGQQKQESADERATQQAAQDMQKVESDVSDTTDDELRNELRRSTHSSS